MNPFGPEARTALLRHIDARSCYLVGVCDHHPLVGAAAGEGFSTIDLDAELGDFKALGALGHDLVLDALSNELSMVRLRRLAHRAASALRPGRRLIFVFRNPDVGLRAGSWPGEIFAEGERYRPWRHYLELARLFPLRFTTPLALGDGGEFFCLALEKQAPGSAFHTSAHEPAQESESESEARASDEDRYGQASCYRRFDRLEEPEILDDLLYGMSRFRLKPGHRVLALGCNDGRELELALEVAGPDLDIYGVDLASSAIAAARERFPDQAENFFEADLNALGKLGLPPMHAVLILNTIQCRGVDRESLLKAAVHLLEPRASLLLSIPNCHYGTEDLLRRPLDRKDRRHDRALVMKDIRYITRYFFRAGFETVESYGTYDAIIFASRVRFPSSG
ncbi:MAG: class I SAM-dependent methyltransferase [Planctomycetota bacterium]